jgi:hypothetical protein
MRAGFVLIFMVVCLLVLGAISYIAPEGGFLVGTYEKEDHGELVTREIRVSYPTTEQLLYPKRVEKRKLDEIIQQRQDSIRIAMRMKDSLSIEDSLNFYMSFDHGNPAILHYPEGDKSVLYDFFSYLSNVEESDTAMHILHYGDSQIEMDRISGYIRERMQEEFGGWGPGLLSAKPLTPAYNMSHQTSENWRRAVPFGPVSFRAGHWRYGPMLSVCSFDSGAANIYVKARKKSTQHVKKYNICKVLYKGQTNISLSGVNGSKNVSNSYVGGGLNVKQWEFDTFQSKASLTFSGDGPHEIYGVSLESKSGVYVDNVPMRGASGTFFRSVDSSLMYHSYNNLNVRMIIMEFGGNVLPVIHSKKKAVWYGNKFYKQIMRLKNTRPEACIVVIGPADMSVKNNGVLETHPYLEHVRDALKSATMRAGCVYWDMYEAMGGKNSMQVWAQHSPKFASADYIHFTKKGAQEISKMFYEALFNDYKIFLLKRKMDKLKNGHS